VLVLAVTGQPVSERELFERGVTRVKPCESTRRKSRAQALAAAQMRVPRECTREVQRRRQGAAAQPHRLRKRAHNRDLEARLDLHVMVASQSRKQRPVGLTAAKEHVLSVV
jgi:hypothetical protein